MINKDSVKNLLNSTPASMTIVLIILFAVASIFSPYFFATGNLTSLIRDLAFIGIIAIAQSLVMLVGDLDLSVGKIAALSGVLGGILMVDNSVDPYVSLIIVIIAGGVLGLINGLLTTLLNLNAIIVTIGMTGVYGGATLILTKGVAITGIPSEISFLGKGILFGIPVPSIIMLLILILFIILLKRTRFGRHIYAVGNNVEAAKILGIKVNLVRTTLFTFVGVLSAIAGLIMLARLGSAQPGVGDTWQLNSIAAAVIGGVALTGGVGNPYGAVVGAAIITIIENIIVLFGISSYWQSAVSGVIVILAISYQSISVMLNKRKEYTEKLE